MWEGGGRDGQEHGLGRVWGGRAGAWPGEGEGGGGSDRSMAWGG